MSDAVSDALGGVAPAPSPAPAAAPAPSPSPSPAPSPAPAPAPSQATDSWQSKFLPEELRNDETLANYNDIPSLAKAHVEIRRWATGRVPIPAADDQVAFADFASKIRPAKAEDYAFDGADGKPMAIDDGYRAKAFEIGLHPIQAKALAEYDAQRQSDAMSQVAQKGKDELTAIELEMGPAAYAQRLTAVENMMKSLGVESAEGVNGFESVHGAGATMKMLFTMAEKTGELAKVDGDTVAMRMGQMSPDAAQAGLDAMAANTDATFQKALRTPGSPEHTKRAAYMDVLRKVREKQ